MGRANLGTRNQCRALIYLGNTGSRGMGIYQTAGSWAILFGGLTFRASSAAVSTGVWTNLALVANTTGATFYVNGVATDTIVGLPNTVSGNMLIGQNQASTEQFIGSLDEGRAFTFTAGQFNPGDLTPAPATVPALSDAAFVATAVIVLALGIGLLVRPDRRSA